MYEHYCPNCNSSLEDQFGFDPDCKTWVCTICDTVLYGDDLEETMDRYSGVVWICDSCGEVLNVQPGFYDYCGTWDCTECGHENNISEDEIYDSEEEYQNSKKHKCPVCESILEDQYSFNEYDDIHTCTNCEIELFKNDEEEYQILFKCPKCDEVLNNQSLFDECDEEYICSECDTELYKNGNEYKIVYRCPNCDEVLNEQYDFDAYEDSYKCDSCDVELYRDGDEYSVLYRCPKCDDLLNEQVGFYEDYDWKCENCGTLLEKMCNEYTASEVDKDNEEVNIITTVNENENTLGTEQDYKSEKKNPKEAMSTTDTCLKEFEPPILSLDVFPSYEEYAARNNKKHIRGERHSVQSKTVIKRMVRLLRKYIKDVLKS